MKLTASLKNKITADWATCFPSLGIYKPMWLLRRVGPLLSGVLLERDSGNDAYRPTFHVHNLAKHADSLNLTLADELNTERTGVPESIRAKYHSTHYTSAAARMEKQALVPLSGGVKLQSVLGAYRSYMQRPIARYPLFLYEDILTTLLWCDKIQDAAEAFEEFNNDVSRWPANINVLMFAGGCESWVNKCRGWLSNPKQIKATVEEQIVVLGVAGLPTINLDF